MDRADLLREHLTLGVDLARARARVRVRVRGTVTVRVTP